MAGTKRSKIKKNDQVVVIAGRDKGKRGRVLEVAPSNGKIKVEGAGMIKRHQKANPQSNRGGGIIEKEAWHRYFERAVDRSAIRQADARAVSGRRRRLEDARGSGAADTQIER